MTDPMGRAWAYAYDSAGDLVSATDPMGEVTSYTYDATNSDPVLAHDLLSVTKPNGQAGGPDAGAKTVNTYDALGRVVTQVDPAGWTTAYEYRSGLETAQYVGYDPASSSEAPSDTTYVRDPGTLLLTTTTPPSGAVTTDTYSALGDVLIQASTFPILPNQQPAMTTETYSVLAEALAGISCDARQ